MRVSLYFINIVEKISWTDPSFQLTITKLISKSARGMNEQPLKTLGTDVLFSRRKIRKTLWGWHPPLPPPRPPCTEGKIMNRGHTSLLLLGGGGGKVG